MDAKIDTRRNRTSLLWFMLSIVGLILTVFVPLAFAQDPVTPPPVVTEPPLNNPLQLLTPEIILALVFLLTIPATSAVIWLFKLDGATAGVVANVVLNAFAKVVILVVTGQATFAFAVISFILGVVLDKVIYELITKRKDITIEVLKTKLGEAR